MSAQQISAYTASPADFDLLLPPPVNDAPVASPVTLASIAEDGASRLITQDNLLVGVTDVDGPNPSITALSIGGQLALANAGTIAATGTQSLVIDAGANTIENSGTLESPGSGGLVINSNLENSGVVWANGGNVSFNGAVTGSGDLLVNGSATVEFAGAASIDTQLASDAMATLIMHDSFNFSGVVNGFDGNDRLDLTDISFTNGVTLGYSASQDGRGGVLQVSDGAHTAIISVLGQYDASGFSTSADNSTGTVVTYDPHHFLV